MRSLSDLDRAHAELLESAQIECRTPSRPLFLSAVGAGLALAFSFLAEAAALGASPPAWQHLLSALAYPLGFVIIVLGRYQLFTEQTLPPVALALARRQSLPALLRVWGVVLVGNAVGAVLVGSVLAMPGLLPDDMWVAAAGIAALDHGPPGAVFLRSVLAGWLVAEMVWLSHQSRGRLAIIWVLTALIPLARLEHVVIGTVEAVFGLWVLDASPLAAASRLSIVLAGNIVGGVVLVALLNHGRTTTRNAQLSWREWILGPPTECDVADQVTHLTSPPRHQAHR
jgi:formate/nitrite transporter FocA (FNT family)